MSEENVSQSEVNKTVRVLNGERLKYTVMVHLPDGKRIEFQAESEPRVKWYDEARCLWTEMPPDVSRPWLDNAAPFEEVTHCRLIYRKVVDDPLVFAVTEIRNKKGQK